MTREPLVSPRQGDTPTDIVWHYTNAAGAHGILTSQRFWATHARHMNDHQEVQWLFNAVLDHLNRDQVKTEHADEAGILAEIRSMVDRFISDDIFVVSFSAADDSLSQWRGYANAGTGYALGFDRDALTSWSRESRVTGRRFVECEYNNSGYHLHAWALLEYFFNQWFDEFPNMKRSNIPYHFYKRLLEDAPTIKHQSFKEEQEWRFIDMGVLASDAKTRPTARGITPYIEIPIPTQQNGYLALREVMLGPGATDEDYHGINRMIGSMPEYGRVEYYRSDIPYRP